MEQPYDRREEFANALTHGLGAVASIPGAAVLVWLALQVGDTWQLLSVSVYGLSLVLLYSASTMYHAVQRDTAKARLRLFDHCAIYLLIAGTYTPFTLGVLPGTWGWTLLGLIWGFAIGGIVYKIFMLGRHPRLSTALYLVMGWIAAVPLPAMVRELSGTTVLWLVLGGVAYTGGTVFFHCRRIRYSHAIWHGFVLAGSACHFLAILTHLLPAASA